MNKPFVHRLQLRTMPPEALDAPYLASLSEPIATLPVQSTACNHHKLTYEDMQ